MTKETEALSLKIKQARNDRKKDEVVKENNGYQVVTEVIVNLFGCILVGTSLGVISNNLLETGDKFTILLSVLGGIAGIWSVIKYAISLDKGNKAK
ncbi:MAG: AtpZ/AtpI family protein [Alphaproteobacteria bacterium]|nr:AtpZ/AtpI family protein [Alphaproteobacteria bacterium]